MLWLSMLSGSRFYLLCLIDVTPGRNTLDTQHARCCHGDSKGNNVATLAWNTTRHLESWYGIMGLAAVCHTLNPRLSDKDLIYIINHAEDRAIMADITFVPILQRILPQCPTVKTVIMMTDRCVESALRTRHMVCT